MTDLYITISRGEGPTEECGIPHQVTSFEEADNVLRKMSLTVLRGSDKIDFTCDWLDDVKDEYSGTYLLKNWKEGSPSLYRHMKEQLEYCCKTVKPTDMSGPNWAAYQKYYGPYVGHSRGLLDRRFS